jgi:hypothetical protein
LSPAEGRKFAFTVGAAFLVIGAIVWWRGHLTAASVLGALGGTLGILGIAIPGKLGPLNRAWMGLAHLISKVTTPIFMGIVYFLVITPISLLMSLFGKRPLRAPRGAATYWIARAPEARRSDLTRQF